MNDAIVFHAILFVFEVTNMF